MTTLSERIERRKTPVTPIIERRGGETEKLPTWVQRARAGALYGLDDNGHAVAGKDMTGRAA